MTEIHCKHCNHTLAKNVELGCGFFYLTPDKDVVLYRQITKCPSCGCLNEIRAKVGIGVEVRIVNEPVIELSGKNNLYSA